MSHSAGIAVAKCNKQSKDVGSATRVRKGVVWKWKMRIFHVEWTAAS